MYIYTRVCDECFFIFIFIKMHGYIYIVIEWIYCDITNQECESYVNYPVVAGEQSFPMSYGEPGPWSYELSFESQADLGGWIINITRERWPGDTVVRWPTDLLDVDRNGHLLQPSSVCNPPTWCISWISQNSMDEGMDGQIDR